MGLDILQSQNLQILLHALLERSSQPSHHVEQLFQTHYFIVPNHGIGQWLQQNIAKKTGISANQHYVALRTFQWEMYQQVLGRDVIAEAPQMLNMKWQIFLYLSQYLEKDLVEAHALYPIMQRVRQQSDFIQDEVTRQNKQQQMLYWVADQTSRLFTNYIIYRGECVGGCGEVCTCPQNWLAAWDKNKAIAVEQRLRRNAEEKPLEDVVAYQLAQAMQLEAWQRYLWRALFAEKFRAIQAIDNKFWQVLLAGQGGRQLPQQIYVFTLLELPPSQLNFLRRLAQYVDIAIFHYTPSQEYWADSVDPKWKASYALKYPHAATLYESRHPLLTRLGKQARDIGALLVQLSGGEEGLWSDVFLDTPPKNLLEKLQSDILHLREPQQAEYRLAEQDRSLQIHVCHSTMRQLEVLKEHLIAWLGVDEQPPRQLGDILILVPNLTEIEPHIRNVFTANFASSQPSLAIKIAGVPILDAVQLWQAFTARIKLLQKRLSLEQFIDYLSLSPIQALYALSFADIQRISELLTEAGFKRGFDAAHLKQSLSSGDSDYRFCLNYALQRLALAMAMPEHALYAGVLSLENVRTSDFELIEKLLRIYADIDARRNWFAIQPIHEQQEIDAHLAKIEAELVYFTELAGFKAVYDAFAKLKRIIRLTLKPRLQQQNDAEQLRLPLQYVLDEIESTIMHQVGQTEPTGYITFAQMGQLRPLPYRLIVCLNLDMGTFPQRDTHIPFDLMELLRAELGDRSRLEDDQGAFLDALLQAQDEFWLFYNGFDVNDNEVRDPSSVVQELTAHLAQIIQPEQPAKNINKDGIDMPSQLAALYYVHRLQPFDIKNFIQPTYASFANQWFQVAKFLQEPEAKQFDWVNCVYPMEAQAKQNIQAAQWIKDLCFPAGHFLRQVGIANIDKYLAAEAFEPLQLDGLQKYTVRDYLQQSFIQNETELNVIQEAQLLQDKLPVGKMQITTLINLVDDHEELKQRLIHYGGVITTLTTWRWSYNDVFEFTLSTPIDTQATIWVSTTASSCTGERPLHIWLEYLLWRASSDHVQDLQRIALFNNKTLLMRGVTQQQAHEFLAAWLEIWQRAQQEVVVLPPALFAPLIFETSGKNAVIWQLDATGKWYLENYAKIEEQWLGKSYDRNSPIKNHDKKSCVLYPDWQLLLGQQDSQRLLNYFTEQYAAKLYYPMSQYITVEKAEQ